MVLTGIIEPSIRERPEDFLVEELTRFEPSGEGGHIALWIQKRGLDHRSMVRRVARAFGVPQSAVGWAGMKDRQAVTLQWITVKTRDHRSVSLDSEDLRVLHAAPHARGLRLGQLTGNRFVIRIRNLDPTEAPRIFRTLKSLAVGGLPNRFMSQRFGYRGANHVIGGHFLRKDWSGLLRCWLGTDGPPWPDIEEDRRLHFDRGELGEAAAAWPKSWQAERHALEQLARGGVAEEVVLDVPRPVRRIWTDAWQSGIFNEVLDRRVADRTLATIVDGDISWSHERFLSEVDGAGPVDVPTGPLWGRRMRRASGNVDRTEVDAMQRTGLSAGLLEERGMPQGNRRPLLVPVASPRCESGFDDHGAFVEVSFELAKGSYATAVIDELMNPAAS